MNDNSFSLRPKVALVTGDSGLGVYIIEQLLVNFCQVFLFTTDQNYWLNKTSHLKENKNFSIKNLSDENEEDFQYVIVSHDFFNKEEDLSFLEKTNSLISRETSNLLILPYACESSDKKKIVVALRQNFSRYSSLKIVFLGDLYGPRMILGTNLFSEKIKQVLVDRSLDLSPDEIYFPTYSPEIAKQIAKTLFSFGTREGMLFYSHRIKDSELLGFFRKFIPGLNSQKENGKSERLVKREFFRVEKRFVVETQISESYSQTFEWFTKNPPEIKVLVRAKSPVKKIKPIKFKRPSFINFKKRIISPTLILIFLPFLILGLSIGSLLTGGLFLKKGNTSPATYFFNFSKYSNSLSSNIFLYYVKVPFVGKIFNSTLQLSMFVGKSTEIALESNYFIKEGLTLFENVISKKDIELVKNSQNLSVLSGNLYSNLGFLESEVASLGIYREPLKSILSNFELQKVRQSLLVAEDVLKIAPELLGENETKTYMILFQNNMEIRPTGGFIGSFGLTSFNKGHMSSFEVYDVYDADGQLKGYVAPPAPIKNYLGEAAWYMRDANWDPDFPASSERIQWFLGKELGKSVDGVIGIDLSVAHSLISAVGKVYVPDYNLEINASNFYEETQKAAEENFFPGSTKKRNFLSAMSRALMQKLTENEIENKISLASNLLASLEKRQIQVSLNDSQAKEVINKAGFDGAFVAPSCEEVNCMADFLGIVEANVGVNKANYYVKKDLNVNVTLQGDYLENTLKIFYKNTAPENSHNSYKNYLRIIVPQDSETIWVKNNEERLDFEVEDVSGRREIGALTVIPQGEERVIEFRWRQKSNFVSGEAIYQLHLRKQAGSTDDPVSLSFAFPGANSLEGEESAFLTTDGASGYNTTLSRDLDTRLKFNK